MRDLKDLIELLLFIAVGILVAVAIVYVLKGEAIANALNDSLRSFKNYVAGTQLPSDSNRPGSALAGFDGNGNPVYGSGQGSSGTPGFVEGGGFGGGGGDAF